MKINEEIKKALGASNSLEEIAATIGDNIYAWRNHSPSGVEAPLLFSKGIVIELKSYDSPRMVKKKTKKALEKFENKR